MNAPLRTLALAALATSLAAMLSGCAGGAAGSSGLPGNTRELRTASDQTPNEKRADIRMQLAIGYFEAGNHAVALDEIKAAITVNPDFSDAYSVRALIYTAMGEMALAEENYQRAMRLAPNNPELNNNYGSFLCQTGRHALAIAQFETALKSTTYQSPHKAMINAGACSIKMKNFDAAERYLMDALRYDAELPKTNASLARVYFERRDFTRAGFFINRLRAVVKPENLSAEDLWLAIRIERKLGDRAAETSLVTQLRRRHPASAEYAAFQRGAYDE